MGLRDTIAKEYMSENDHFSDAFNYLFGKKAFIRPEDLTEQDATELAVIEHLGAVFEQQRIRDILKSCVIKHSSKATLVLLGIENQSEIHYALPVKNLLYDALNYAAQVEAQRSRHRQDRDLTTSGEFLSGFAKSDQLTPVITLTIYFGNQQWDAPRSLLEMTGEIEPTISGFVNDYHSYLIIPSEIDDFSTFTSELRNVLEFVKYSDDKKKIYDLVHEDASFKEIDIQTVHMINAFTNAGIPTEQAEGGRIDMCKAMEGLLQDSRNEGLMQGRAEGLAEGRAEGRVEGRAEGRAEGRVEGIASERQSAIERLSAYFLKQNPGMTREEAVSQAKMILQ